MGMLTNDFFDKLKRYSAVSKQEIKPIIITILAIAFIVTFDKWGVGDTPDLGIGLSNLVIGIAIVAFSFFARYYMQKVFALAADLKVEYSMWSFGILFSVILGIVSVNWPIKIWFLITGSVVFTFLAGSRLGWSRYGLNHFGMGVIAIMGPVGNMFAAMIFRALDQFYPNVWYFHAGFLLNLSWALWSLVPLPPSDGSKLIFGSRLVYVFSLTAIVSSSILLYSTKINALLSIPLSVLIGLVCWLIYYIVWERFNWNAY